MGSGGAKVESIRVLPGIGPQKAELFAKLGIGETEVIQITVSRMNVKHNFAAEPAPWLITGRGGV